MINKWIILKIPKKSNDTQHVLKGKYELAYGKVVHFGPNEMLGVPLQITLETFPKVGCGYFVDDVKDILHVWDERPDSNDLYLTQLELHQQIH